MLTASQILKSKANQTVHVVSADTSVLDAVRTMAEHHIGALIVMQADTAIGIVTERDLARKFVPMNRLPSETRVQDVMTSPLVHVAPGESAETCLALMAERHFRHLPVIDNGRVAGVISISDLIREVPAKQQYIIEQLQRYIRGDLR